MSRVHSMPMCPQLIDEQEWARDGGQQLGDRLEWSDRACGMASLRMILLSYGAQAPSLTELVILGAKAGALSERGWIHAAIGEIGAQFGVPGRAEAVPAGELLEHLHEAPLIISVTQQLPDDGRKGGHLIVAHGYHPALDGRGTNLLIRCPSRWGQHNPSVTLSRALASYSGRAILFPRKPI